MATYWKDRYLKAKNANVAVLADYVGENASSQQGFESGIATDGVKQGDRIAPSVTGVSETMLWSLHNRACEARRHDTVLTDPDSINIHEAIDYDFTRHFGEAAGRNVSTTLIQPGSQFRLDSLRSEPSQKTAQVASKNPPVDLWTTQERALTTTPQAPHQAILDSVF
jgi:hypothetical protein